MSCVALAGSLNADKRDLTMSSDNPQYQPSIGRGGGGRGRGRGGGRGRGRGGRQSNNNNSSSSNNNNNNENNNSGRGRGRGGGRGGGRGKSPRPGGGGNEQQQQRQAPRATTPAPPPKKKLVNGEKGADAHTVSEAERIKFTKILIDFREQPITDNNDNAPTKLEFDSTLTNTERKFIHELAGQLGLQSKSTGKGDNRRIAVTLRKEQRKRIGGGTGGDGGGLDTVKDDERAYLKSLPRLKIGKRGTDALRKHMQSFPPSHFEAMESRETGASLLEAIRSSSSNSRNNNSTARTENVNGGGGGGGNGNVIDDDDAAVAATLHQFMGDHVDKASGNSTATNSKYRPPRPADLERRQRRHADFQRLKTTKYGQQYQRVLTNRSKLPAFARQDEIIATVAANPVTIIQGETGCGKSTQCPQFILDANPEANIAVTQPRRISAISIAERVAQEQCLDGTDSSVGSLVGYQVRLESATSKDTQLVFLTPGILLRKLQSSPMLIEYTHIIIDEVHERDKYTEFLMITLRDLLPRRPDLRLVLMSATLQIEVLLSYFTDRLPENDDLCSSYYQQYPPVMLKIQGRTFPVQEYFLEDVLMLTKYIDLDTLDDEGKEENDNVMSMDQLDAELAKLLGGGKGSGAIVPKDVGETIGKCALCGRVFADPVELGQHVAICTGIPSKDGMDGSLMGVGLDVDNRGKQAALLTPAMLGSVNGEDDSGQAIDIEGFDDYDEGAEPEAVEFQFQDVMLYPTEEEAGDEMGDKWDGQGLFQADVGFESDAKIDKLLDRYQIMHDDGQVDIDLLVEVLHYINKASYGEGAILVFLPGWQEISEFSMMLENTIPFNNRSKFLVLPLHSGIPSADQRKVLRRPPVGVRKIVLSTNIAETSLTIDDVSFVVDAGRAKEKDYDPHLKTSTLQSTWISQSSAKQRKGRAGRTKAGVCFHLFSSRRYASLRPFVESELLRTPLEEMCLMTKKLGLAPGGPEDPDGVPAFLSKAITPPHEKSVSNALELLVDLGAMLPETNDLTSLGECLSVLSLEPRVGKMVIWSYVLGCTRVASQMAVSMSYKSPFVLPPSNMRRDAERAQLALSNGSESDQITVFNAIVKRDELKKQKSEAAYRDWCRRNFLGVATLSMVADLRKNLSRELASLGFADPMSIGGYHNRHDKQQALWQAAISAGLYPNVATRTRGDVNFSTMTNRKAKVHVSSVNAIKGQPLNSKSQIPDGEVEFVAFGEMVRGSHFFTLSQTTHLPSPLPLLLLCGISLSIHTPVIDGDELAAPGSNNGDAKGLSVLNLDDWIVFSCPTEVASSLVVLRKRLESAFWNAISKRNGQQIQSAFTPTERDAIETLGEVLQSALKSSDVR